MIDKTPGGVSVDELEYSGIADMLQNPKVTKSEMMQQARDNAIDIKDVVKSTPKWGSEAEQAAAHLRLEGARLKVETLNADSPGWDAAAKEYRDAQAAMETVVPGWGPPVKGTKFHEGSMGSQETVLPGGEDYKEMLLTLPSTKRMHTAAEKDEFMRLGLTGDHTKKQAARYDELNRIEMAPRTDYTGGHYDEPNVLAHARYNTRQIDGDKTLFGEEFQDDWRLDASKGADKKAKAEGLTGAEHKTRVNELMKGDWEQLGVPNRPYKNKGTALAFQRFMREAVDTGHDRIAWTTGATQKARYNLSKHVEKVEVWNLDDGSRSVNITGVDGTEMYRSRYSDDGVFTGMGEFKGKEISEVIGKDMAEKIMAVPPRESYAGVRNLAKKFDGKDLEIGGEWADAAYDRMRVNEANKFAKKYGQKVEVKKIEAGEYIVTDASGELGRFKTKDEAIAAKEKWDAIAGTNTDITGEGKEVWSLKLTPEMKKDILSGGVALGAAGIAAPGLAEALMQQPEF
jgi:hypothetical protein